MISLVILSIYFLYSNSKIFRDEVYHILITAIENLVSYIKDTGNQQGNIEDEEEEITEEQYIQMEKNFLLILDVCLSQIYFSWNIKKVYLNMDWISRKQMLKRLDMNFFRMNNKEMMANVLDALDTQIEVDRICNNLMGKNKMIQ